MVTTERPEAATTEPEPTASEFVVRAYPLRVQMPAEWKVTDEHFLELCSLNEGWRIEADGEGGLLIMAPTGPMSSARGGRIYSQTLAWSDAHESGMVFESSATFLLPNGDRRMPDAAWISDERLEEIVGDGRIIWRTCPDFIVEVRSDTDRLEDQQRKMEMWVSQGARVAWLVDPREQVVWIYRPEREPERLERPESVTATEIADDLTIDFSRIWPRQDPVSESS